MDDFMEDQDRRIKTWEKKQDEYLAIGKGFPYRDYIKDDGEKKFSPKPQYSRQGDRFNCPYCDFTCSSHSFNWYSGFEQTIFEHMGEFHPDWKERLEQSNDKEVEHGQTNNT